MFVNKLEFALSPVLDIVTCLKFKVKWMDNNLQLWSIILL